ncbi:helix-turn-helix domain-containing protein [Staphylococcus capitis]|uniref:AlbA family DNA-binding domain-containing protein n=1 Tax=Staphylococcus capitis TaxID=29388 RepID=UPI0019D316B0|nr:ATP-binding protein [Staphylococcus capitis]MBN6785215.1 ATP-binding protein [Staphylococcus capitis]
MININTKEIWDNKLAEDQKLEYKQYFFTNGKFSDIPDKAKNKLLQVISSFANSMGGKIILGIGEDDNHNPNKLIDVGVNEQTLEMWEQSFRQYISSKIKPVIYGIKVSLEIVENVNLLRIDVPMSLVKPHAINNGSRDDLYIRYENMTTPMLYEDIRNAFDEKTITENKIINFKNERLGMLLGGEIASEIYKDTAMVIHIIPETSIKLNSYTNLSKAEDNRKLDVFSPLSDSIMRRGLVSYNMDGLLISHESYNKIGAYTQMFHNGSIEITEIRMMNLDNQNSDKKYIYNWIKLEKLLFEKLHDFIEVMGELEIPKPYIVFVTLLNTKGKQSLGDFETYPSKPFSRNIIHSMPAYINEEENYQNSMYPLLTSLSNAFGMKNSKVFKEKSVE